MRRYFIAGLLFTTLSVPAVRGESVVTYTYDSAGNRITKSESTKQKTHNTSTQTNTKTVESSIERKSNSVRSEIREQSRASKSEGDAK